MFIAVARNSRSKIIVAVVLCVGLRVWTIVYSAVDESWTAHDVYIYKTQFFCF